MKANSMKRSLILFTIILLTVTGFSQTKPYEIKTLSNEDLSLKDYVEVFEDSTKQLTIEQVSSPDFENRFHENKLVPRKITENQSGVIWGRFRLKNLTGRDINKYLLGLN